MARRREAATLEEWVASARASGIPALCNFATGLRRDWAAVVADDASIAVRQGIVWLEGDGGIEIRKGAIEVAHAMVGDGAVMICEREPGLESDRGIVVATPGR